MCISEMRKDLEKLGYLIYERNLNIQYVLHSHNSLLFNTLYQMSAGGSLAYTFQVIKPAGPMSAAHTGTGLAELRVRGWFSEEGRLTCHLDD